jgi:hypothetical protein
MLCSAHENRTPRRHTCPAQFASRDPGRRRRGAPRAERVCRRGSRALSVGAALVSRGGGARENRPRPPVPCAKARVSMARRIGPNCWRNSTRRLLRAKCRATSYYQQRRRQPGTQPRPGGAADQQYRPTISFRGLRPGRRSAAQSDGGPADDDQQTAPASAHRMIHLISRGFLLSRSRSRLPPSDDRDSSLSLIAGSADKRPGPTGRDACVRCRENADRR